MEHPDEEDDLKLAKASAGLLSDLETSLPKLLWKPSKPGSSRGSVHSRVRRKDLDYVVDLIEPFQGEPQLLDARLKYILPPIVEAYLEFLRKPSFPDPGRHVDLQTALATILYVLCKVRGAKVIVGFLNNEPRHLELVLASLENITTRSDASDKADWKVPYVLLLWLSHLLLAPFDLASISSKTAPEVTDHGLGLRQILPSVAQWIINLGLAYLPKSTKAQDAAASMLVRLVTRPDMQKLQLGDALVDHAIYRLSPASDVPTTVYQQLGPLRFLAGISTSADLGHLVPNIYRECENLTNESNQSPISTNAVGKRLIVKTFRNIAILSLRSVSLAGPLASFLDTTSVLEDVIDYLLRSLGDRDTPVRYAAAKAISSIVLELDPAMGHEVIQAVIDTFKEDMPRNSTIVDYRTVNALKWHGLTLALSHALFKRSAAPEQLLDIVEALVSALNFEQRTATGGSVGTNVRDAANFGIWSLSRRYTTAELLSVDAKTLRFVKHSTLQCSSAENSVIRAVAVQLLLSSCCDPAGNIRRGSSAALQELIGRHPNQVVEGIALVQIVDYQAVGLRRRAMVDVAGEAAKLDSDYWSQLIDGLIAWRGLGSQDVPSREAAAESIARLSTKEQSLGQEAIGKLYPRLLDRLNACAKSDIELQHGLVLSLARLLELLAALRVTDSSSSQIPGVIWQGALKSELPLLEFSPRVLRSELPAAMAKLTAAICHCDIISVAEHGVAKSMNWTADDAMDSFVERLLARHEDSILDAIPYLVCQLLDVKRMAGVSPSFLETSNLGPQVETDGAKATLHGAGRAISLGALAVTCDSGLSGSSASLSINILADLLHAMNVDWRITALRALHLTLENVSQTSIPPDPNLVETLVRAIHTGLNDHTIDERGDIGSLVRLQALTCASQLLNIGILSEDANYSVGLQTLHADILRLSLEKLDRVRSRAAQIRSSHLPTDLSIPLPETENPTSEPYFRAALLPLLNPQAPTWIHRALLEGLISCAGTGSETLLQTSRKVLAQHVSALDDSTLHATLNLFSHILRDLPVPSTLMNGHATLLLHPALCLLQFLLDMRIPQRLNTAATGFKWRSLLSAVQKSHHKSSDLPRLLAAVQVYRALAEVEALRVEVLKKLLGMLAGNPFPIVRVAVAEALWGVLEGELREGLKGLVWTGRGEAVGSVRKELVRRLGVGAA